jgi:hypothetical protein
MTKRNRLIAILMDRNRVVIRAELKNIVRWFDRDVRHERRGHSSAMDKSAVEVAHVRLPQALETPGMSQVGGGVTCCEEGGRWDVGCELAKFRTKQGQASQGHRALRSLPSLGPLIAWCRSEQSRTGLAGWKGYSNSLDHCTAA